MRRGWIASLVVLACGLAGCDARFTATGRVAEVPGLPKTCRLFTREVNGGISCCSGPVDPLRIQREFWVWPGRLQYQVVLECPGFQDYVASGVFGQDMSAVKPLQIGSIFLTPK